MKIQSYKELIVWQKSVELVKDIYDLTSFFPSAEIYGLTSQIRRAAVSIPSNIAEGYGRKSHKEYLQFYSISYGSSLELETQLIIAKELCLAPSKKFEKPEVFLNEVIKMLYVMIYRRKSIEGIAYSV